MKKTVIAEAMKLNDIVEIAEEEYTVILVGTNTGNKVMLCLQDSMQSSDLVWLTLNPRHLIKIRRK